MIQNTINKTYILEENPFVIFIEKLAPILIIGSIFLVIFDKFEILFELKDVMPLNLIVFLAVIRGILVLRNNKCAVTIMNDSITLSKGNNLPIKYKFNDIEKLSYMYYGIYNVIYNDGTKDKILLFNELIQIEKKYIDINTILLDILQEKFDSHYTEDLIKYSKEHIYPDYLIKYDKSTLRKRIVATIFYVLFSLPIIILFFINNFLMILGLIFG